MRMLLEPGAEEFVRFLNLTRVPLQYAGPVRVRFPDERTPRRLGVVQMDARQRPDVADLARVVRAEGIQKLNPCPPYFGMAKGMECMVVAMILADPVQCIFSFVLPWLPCRELFGLIHQHGFFYLTAAVLDHTLFQTALRVRVPLDEVAEAMAEWEAGDGLLR